MAVWTCDFEECMVPAAQSTDGACKICARHLCTKHDGPEYHRCPRPTLKSFSEEPLEPQLEELLRRINKSALTARASEVRSVGEGKHLNCVVVPVKEPALTQWALLGGRNYHIGLRFEDGVEWIVRIRRREWGYNRYILPRKYSVTSEWATLQFLTRTNIPVPRSFDFACETEPSNMIGVDYILLEKPIGKSLHWPSLNEYQRDKVLQQWADICIELYKHPLDRLGALVCQGDGHVGPLVFDMRVNHEKEGAIYKAFSATASPVEFRTSFPWWAMSIIADGHWCRDRPIDAWLVYRHLVRIITDHPPRVLPGDDGKYYLRHADSRGEHILIDDDFNFLAIFNWDWAYVTSPAIAFSSPHISLPLTQIYAGSNNLAAGEIRLAQILEEKNAENLAEYVRTGRFQQRISLCLGSDPTSRWKEFILLFQGLRDAAGEKYGAGLPWEQWRIVALEEYKDDEGLRKLLEDDWEMQNWQEKPS